MSQNTSQNTQTAAQKRILTWLNDAYTMEIEGAKTLERHANAAGDYPEVQSRLQRHAEETRRHAEEVKSCAQRLGGQPSAAREAIGMVIGAARGVATRAAKDTVVKNALADYASEHFEIACYKSLVAAAEREGDQETARVCREILEEEEAMVGFLDEQIGDVTERFLTKQSSDEQRSNGSTQSVQESGQKLLKGAQQNALPIVGGLVIAGAGAGLLLTRVLGSKQQSGDQDMDRDVYGSSGYQDEGSPYDAVRSGVIYSPEGEVTGYAQPEQPFDQNMAASTQLESDRDSGLQSGGLQEDLRSSTQRDGFQSDIVGVQSTAEQPRSAQSSADAAGVAVVEAEESPTGNPTADEIMARLKEHRQVDDSDIEVTVEKNGRVTLKGTVDNKDVKQRAEKAVAGVLSVGQVRNQLKVKSS